MTKKILILDNDATIREMIGTSYNISGHIAYMAANIKSALEIVLEVQRHNETIDAVLFDMSLSIDELAGFLFQSRNFFPAIGFVGLTSYQSEDMVDRIRLLGASEYISKPFDLLHVQCIVERAIEKRGKYLQEKAAVVQPRIILVDDDESVRDVLTTTLIIEGYEVDAAASVHDALEKLQEKYYHIIITDLMMDNISGMELTSAVRLMDEDTIIIIITGYPNLESARDAVKHHVYEYLVKPVDPEDLTRVIRNVWEKQKLKWLTEQQKKELERAYNELKNTQQQLIHIAKIAAIGELAAGIAHELNQPLNGLRMIAGSIKRDIKKNRFDTEMLFTDMTEAEKYIIRMADIIDHLRIYTRYSDQMELISTDINKTIQNSIKLFGEQLAKKNIKLKISLSDNLPNVMAVPHELEQVFINLITNARDALESRTCKNEEKKILIESSFSEKKDKVIISVTDNGGGVPDKIRDKIFNPFFTTKPSGKGTGLGLSIILKILERFGGKVELIVKEPESIFLVILPSKEL